MSTNSHLKSREKLVKHAPAVPSLLSGYDIIDGDEERHLLLSSCEGKTLMGTYVRPFNPRHWTYRYTVLFLIAIIQLTLNFSLDVPAGLESVLIDTMAIDVAEYAMLYSIYSWPSVVLTVLGAILVNQYLGCRAATIIFMALLCVGQAVFAVGAFTGVFWVMMASRFILGVGGEIAFITTDAFTAHWFKGHEISIAFGFIGGFCRVGGAGGLYLNNMVYNLCDSIVDKNLRLGLALLFTVLILILATLLSLVLALMDRHAEKTIKDHVMKDNSKFSIKEIFNFNTNFWIMAAMCILYFSTIFPFVAIAQVFLGSKYGLSIDLANVADLLIFVIPITAPLLGIIINWTGFNIYWSLAGILVAVSAHLLYLLSSGDWFIPFVANVALGLSFGCVNTALWSAPPLLVNNYQLVTAYGVLEAGTNLGFAIVDIVSGQLIDNFGYFVHELFFVSLLVVTVLLTLWLLVNLMHTKSCVNKSGYYQKKLREMMT